MEQIACLPHLLVQRFSNSRIRLAKVVDDFPLAGSRQAIKGFHRQIAGRFEVGRFVLAQNLLLNRLHIHQDSDFSVSVNMHEYLDKIQPLEVPRTCRKQWTSPCSSDEFTRYLGLAGSLNFLGHGILPQASFAASYLQKRVGRLSVSHLVDANKVLNEIKSLDPSFRYLAPPTPAFEPCYLVFSDASQVSSSYGQTGHLSGLYLSAGWCMSVPYVGLAELQTATGLFLIDWS